MSMADNRADSSIPELSNRKRRCEIDLPDADAVLCLSYRKKDSRGTGKLQEEQVGTCESRQEMKDKLVDILMDVGRVNQVGSEHRDFLLQGLPISAVQALPRDDHPRIDLNGMVEAVMRWGELDDGRLAVAVFIRNALPMASGIQQGRQLSEILATLPTGFRERLSLRGVDGEV